MDMFWKWLMRANAKALFAVTLLACLGVVLWVGVNVLRKEPARASRSLPARTPQHLDLLSFVDTQLRVDAAWFPTTPFRPSVGRRVMPARPDVVAGGGTPTLPTQFEPFERPTTGGVVRRPVRGRRTKGKVPSRRPVRGQPLSPSSQEAQPIVLTYHGVLQRSDGVTLALVADSSSQSRHFYRVGDELAGMQVARVGDDALWVRDAAGAQLRLTSGDPVTCLDGRLIVPEDGEEVLP